MRRVMLAVVLAGSTGLAVARIVPPPEPDVDQPQPRWPTVLVRADANGDGVVTPAEVMATADARFGKRDTNRDDTITRDDMRADHYARGRDVREPPPPQPGQPPAPGGRRVTPTRDAMRARAAAHFDRVDADRHGRVDRAERAVFRQQRRAPRADHHSPVREAGVHGHATATAVPPLLQGDA